MPAYIIGKAFGIIWKAFKCKFSVKIQLRADQSRMQGIISIYQVRPKRLLTFIQLAHHTLDYVHAC